MIVKVTNDTGINEEFDLSVQDKRELDRENFLTLNNSGYMIEIAKAPDGLRVSNAMDGWGDNKKEEFKDCKVIIE